MSGKQTLVNAEVYYAELKEYETKILTAQERSGEIELRIFAELRRQLLEAAGKDAGDGAEGGRD
jgi:DNA mismatch repair protein MutS